MRFVCLLRFHVRLCTIMAYWTRRPGLHRLRGRRRQKKYNAHELVTALSSQVTHKTHSYTNNANRKHNTTMAIRVIRLFAQLNVRRSAHLGVCSSQTPGNLLDSFYFTVARVNVQDGERSTVILVFPRGGLHGSQGIDRDKRYDCHLSLRGPRYMGGGVK
jgi:hypothetical protein